MLMSMTKEVVENKTIDESSENVAEDDLNDVDEIIDDALMMERLLERAKTSFLEL